MDMSGRDMVEMDEMEWMEGEMEWNWAWCPCSFAIATVFKSLQNDIIY